MTDRGLGHRDIKAKKKHFRKGLESHPAIETIRIGQIKKNYLTLLPKHEVFSGEFLFKPTLEFGASQGVLQEFLEGE